MQCATGHYDIHSEMVFDAIQSVGAVAELFYDLLVNSMYFMRKIYMLYSPLKL